MDSFSVTSANIGELWATYTVHLRLIEKLVVDFLFVLIKLFTPGVTTEALSEYQLEIGFLRGIGDSVWPNFYVEGDVAHQTFLHGSIGQ